MVFLLRSGATAAVSAAAHFAVARSQDINLVQGGNFLQAAFISDWLAPTLATVSTAAAVQVLPQNPLPEGAPKRALQRDADALLVSTPLCLLANVILLIVWHAFSLDDQPHILCWVVDWLLVVPCTTFVRSAFASSSYYYDELDWRAFAQWSTTGISIFDRSSSIDHDCTVQVREHAGGWRTLRFITPTGVNIQSLHKMTGAQTVDATSVANEYIKCMSALALSALEGAREPRILCIGLGGGSIPSLFRSIYSECRIVAVELDATVIDAATSCLGLRESGDLEVVCGDGLEWVGMMSAHEPSERLQFDIIFVDVFDAMNLTPRAFYSEEFLADARRLLAPGGMLLHNLHTGSRRLDAAFLQASSNFAAQFGRGHCCSLRVSTQGNTILGAKSDVAFGSPLSVRGASSGVSECLGLSAFDVSSRLGALSIF